MNISQPVSSSVDRVEFTFLTKDEIHAISVKKIENDSTFDTLLNPVRGGLYDPALGSWGDSICTTCNLGQQSCPGHPGHIDLPVPVYHPTFMDQVLRLVRAQCVYCDGFRLPRRDIHRYTCILRLLQYGLLHEARMVEAIGENLYGLDLPGVPQDYVAAGSDSEDQDGTADGIMRARDAYVRRILQSHPSGLARRKHEGAAELRTATVAEFFKDIVKTRVCASCQGVTPTYRKDRSVKIFEKALSPKEQAKMAQGGFKRRQAIPVQSKKKADKNSDYDLDEGIADLSSSDGEGGASDEGSGDALDEDGLVVPHTKVTKLTRGDDSPAQRYLSPAEVRWRLARLFDKEQEVLSLVYCKQPRSKVTTALSSDMFFLESILIPPNRFRPEARTGDSQIAEAQQNNLYKMIIRASAKLASIYRQIQDQLRGTNVDPSLRGPRSMTQLHEAWTELQEAVNSLIDRNLNPVQGAAAKRNEEGIKQKLEKKEGLFRKNMMGKRVNYAARSVISPDPNIETNEIGVPPVFARKLTFPEPVTSHNFKDMQQAVINGVEKWPGASAIENENGQTINLRNKSMEDRVALANQLLAPTNTTSSGLRNKKVHRHLANGDVVLMNRQPTLHKPSIMGHRVRVLPGEKTIRMHYANCNTYNADFDGDEMNMHFPQNEVARAEALQLADTDHQYISGTAGKPLRGLIQDHLSVSVALCNLDTFFDRQSYQQLIYGALRPESGHILGERIELIAPAILKPVARWTGKQVITTILKNIKPPNYGNLWMSGKTQIPAARWGQGSDEAAVLFHDGVFISGILDKSQLGPSSGGFIHSVHEVYGPAVAGRLLSSMGREENRKKKLAAASDIGLRIAAKYVSLEKQQPGASDPELLARLEEVLRDDSKQEGLDVLMNQGNSLISSAVTEACLPNGLEKQFPKNQMQSMTTSGAKGSQVNANLISCNLGQQVLEGRRVPVMVSGKSLPSFRPFDSNVRAGGYIVNRFLTGIRPQEYYFHHMAGREGLIDTAVKTSRSGYLQRCLIKGMEGLSVGYDSSVRDSDGTLVQFLYGEDGLDIAKQKYLTNFGFVLRNFESQMEQTHYAEANALGLFDHKDDFFKRNKLAVKKSKANIANTDEPVNCVVNPARHAFATSEKFYDAMSDYIKMNKDGLVRDKKEKGDKYQGPGVTALPRKQAEKIFAAKYLRSLVEPGEAVGIVAGQSVGEPSTQMTLNTFHLAGHSAKNVTLGIPRLREILMTASADISTPSMTLVLNEELSEADGERFAKAISVLPLSHVTDNATVSERVGKGIGYPLAKIFLIRLRFFPASEYEETYNIKISDVLDTVEKKFLSQLQAMIKKEIKKKSNNATAATPEVGVKAGTIEMADPNREGGGRSGGDDEDDDDDDGDDDATNAKQRANRNEAASYGPNDDDDDAIQRRLEQEATQGDIEEDEGFEGSPPPSGHDSEDESKTSQDAGGAESLGREQRVKSKHPQVTKFRCSELSGSWCEFELEFDVNIPKILMLNLVEDAVRKTLIQQIQGIGQCTFVAKEKMTDARTGEDVEVSVVHTAGANLQAMQRFGEYINPNKISTNDIAAVLAVYGVEAARNSIIQELSNVFGSHGISVDNRHLNLIGDHMTRSGGFSPFNRMGLRGNVSPFTKMSFETTLAFLKDALLDGDWDDLSTPSSRLVMGRLGKVGTGAFDIFTQAPMSHYDPMRADDEMEQ
ncbi:DNA-directed RNA polymerase activity protein, partial [Cryphonectria parasitica EP155]